MSPQATRETRSLKAPEFRADSEGGKHYLRGYAARYDVLSEDLGYGLRERILPGAFKRAIKEGQDVRHLVNHDPSLILGRTSAGTPENGIGSLVSRPRAAIMRARADIRPSACPSAQPMTSQAKGITTSIGTPACIAAASAISRRTLMRWAACTVRRASLAR